MTTPGRTPSRSTTEKPTCPTHGDRAITRDEGQGGSGPFGPWYCLICKNEQRRKDIR